MKQKILKHQRWSKVNRNVLIEYGGSGIQLSDQPLWCISIDTPNYNDFTVYCDHHASKTGLKLYELEDFIEKHIET